MRVYIKVSVSKDIKTNAPQAIEAGVWAVYNFLREYHKNFNWRGEHWMGGVGSGDFANQVVEGWQPPQKRGNRWVIFNTFGLLDWKTKGGTITAKRSRYLAIPLLGEAKRVPPKEFNEPLFRAGSALCRRIGKRIEAVYALKKSVSQGPWPDAMPDEERIQEVFIEAVRQAVATSEES